MAPELRTKKRKAAVPDDEVEKVKKVKQMAAEVLPKKRKATEDAKPSATKKTKAPKANTDILTTLPKSSTEVSAASKSLTKAIKKAKATPVVDSPSDIENDEDEAAINEPDSDIDDQTEALLAGFDSDSEDQDVAADAGYTGQAIPDVPKKSKKKARKAAEKAAKANAGPSTPGVVYLGRIPHGFYENEMKQYFRQFGDISRLRLSRNKATGRSKHFAFIEFKSSDVADIVAKTMDNYLLFGHILKCKLVPAEQIHEKLWEGANRRFKKVPWNKMEGRKLAMGLDEKGWDARIGREEERRVQKAEKLKALGLDYEFEAPKLKSVAGVPKRKRETLVLTADADADEEANAEEEVKAIEAPKDVAVVAVVEEAVEVEVEVEVPTVKKASAKAKKGKKAKTTA